MSFLDHLECGHCGERYGADRLIGLCRCGRPLLARYRMDEIGAAVATADLPGREPTMWRYRELLPDPGEARVCLGEGFTPLLRAKRRPAQSPIPAKR